MEEIVAQAQGMTLDELFQKVIEKSNSKRFNVVGNSSSGKSVLQLCVEVLQKIDTNYTLDYEGGWQQPKENKIFDHEGKWKDATTGHTGGSGQSDPRGSSIGTELRI